MFKPKNKLNQMNLNNFGVGSIIKLSFTKHWLLVAKSNTTEVFLVDLETFQYSINSVTVEDISYISEPEARDIARLTKLNCAFSDFDFDSNGLKFQR